MWVEARMDCGKLVDGMEIAEDVLDPSGRILLKAPQTVDSSLRKTLGTRGVPSVVIRIWKEKDSEEILSELRLEVSGVCDRHRYLKDDQRRKDSVRLFVRAIELSKNAQLPLGEPLCNEGE